MGYVQFILNNRRKAQTETPSASSTPTSYDLPGLHRKENQQRTAMSAQKKEYSQLLKELQRLNKKINSEKGDERKETRLRINALKGEMKLLLGKIGIYSPSEEAMGFKEDGDGF